MYLFPRKLCHAIRPRNLTQSCDQHAFGIIARAGFIQHKSDKNVLVNNFADFPDVRVKKITFRPAADGVWNYQHLLFEKVVTVTLSGKFVIWTRACVREKK